MNKLPDFNVSHIDSEEFRNFIRKYARPKAMEGWDHEKTFLRGGEKISAVPTIREILEKVATEKDAQWIGQLLRAAPAVPLRIAERGVDVVKNLGKNIYTGMKATPGAPAVPSLPLWSQTASRLPGGELARAGAGLALAGGGYGAYRLMRGAPAPAAAPITHDPKGAPAPVKTAPKAAPAAAVDPDAKAKSDAVDAAVARSASPQVAPIAPPAPAAVPAAPQPQPQQAPPQTAANTPPGEMPRTEISQEEIARSPGVAGNIVAYINENGKRPSREELAAWTAQRQHARAAKRKHVSYYIDPKTQQRMEISPETGEWAPKAASEKTAADTRDVLRWLLGSALIGAGARGSVSLYHKLTQPAPLKPSDHLYDPEIEIPVDVTPEQMAKYKVLTTPAAKKTAAAWDNTLAALTMTGGGVLGWSLAHAMIRRAKERKLDARLQALRGELAQLSQPTIQAEELTTPALKQAAAQDFFYIAAERYQKHIKEAAVPKQLLDLVRKAKLLGRQGMRKGKDTWQGMDPMMKVLAAGGAGLAAAPLLPGVRHITGGVGDVASGGVLEGLKTVGRPLGYGAAATLGPVAALGALYALYKGYQTAEKDDPRAAELSALRQAIREREIEERPYFKLTPRVQERAAA